MKMRKIKYVYMVGASLLTLFITQRAVAQDAAIKQTSPASIELLKAGSLWMNSTNGAGLVLDNLSYFSDIKFTYGIKDGDYKLNQEGEKERLFGVSSEGGLKLGKGYAWGGFAYSNEAQRGTLFNTAIIDPQRGMPYYPIDPNKSDWMKQTYDLSMKVATRPFWDKVILGAQADYMTKVGAKQIDPRSEVYYYRINVKPSAIVILGNHNIGVNFEYQNSIETSGTMNSDGQVNQPVFVLRGLGNGYEATVGGLQSLGDFIYTGNKTGGGLQYSYSVNNLKFLASGNYTYGVEDVISSPMKPKKEGSIIENVIEGKLVALKKGDNLQRLELSYRTENLDGIEYVQELDNSYDVQSWVVVYSSIRSNYKEQEMSFKYDFFSGVDHDYNWRAGISAQYKKNDDIYYMPESTEMLENLYLGVNGKYNFSLCKNCNILVGANLVYKNNLDGEYNYGGAEPDSYIITDFMTPDFQYMKSSYTKIGGDLSYFTKISKTGKAGMFIKAAVDYYKPSDRDDNRIQSSLSLGFTF
ncbi:MAG: hypothetical protein VB022_03995 [Rikenellaceae bacterium]|nr:hypothetical protein [Rikenellaceae bacterium]